MVAFPFAMFHEYFVSAQRFHERARRGKGEHQRERETHKANRVEATKWAKRIDAHIRMNEIGDVERGLDELAACRHQRWIR